MRALFALALLGLTALPGTADAATYERPLALEDLAQDAERAIVGEVISTWIERTPNGIWTVASIVVDETLHGEHEPVVEVRWPGGVVGKIELIVPGTPSVHVGDDLLAFVSPEGQFVGLAQGAFQIDDGKAVRDMSGIHFRESGEAAEDTFPLDTIREILR